MSVDEPTLAKRTNPTINNIAPMNEAMPDPYLSEMAPKIKAPAPAINPCSAKAKPNVSLPTSKYSVTGIRYKPKECVIPPAIKLNIKAPRTTKKRIIYLLFKIKLKHIDIT